MILIADGWERTSTGDPSNSGTTVSCLLVQRDCVYVANVGDSNVVWGNYNPKHGKKGEPEVIAKLVTKRHKPDNVTEKLRIESLGGKIAVDNKGMTRVVWQRRCSCTETAAGVSQVELIPYLNISRSLGDLWSATKECHDYLISPIPDVRIYSLDHTKHSFVILASDGMWDMLSPQEAVNIIHDLCKKTNLTDIPKILVTTALERWNEKSSPADNISVIVGFFNITDANTSMDCGVGKRPHFETDDIPTSKRTSVISSHIYK